MPILTPRNVFAPDREPPKNEIIQLLEQIAGGTAGVGDYQKAWAVDVQYVAKDFVKHGGSIWYALRDNIGVTPVEGADWTLMLPGVTVAASAISALEMNAGDAPAIRRKLNVSSRFMGFYNGQGGLPEYDHFVTHSSNPLSFGAGVMVNARSENQSPTIAKDNKIKAAPTPVRVGDLIYVYYDGYGDQTSPMVGNIFVEIYDLDGNPRDRGYAPIIVPSQVAGAASLARPSVIYEPSDGAAPFKMHVAVATVAGALNTKTHLLTSPNGFTWTDQGQALAVAGVGWESQSVMTTGRVVKKDGLYYLFYAGYDGAQWKGGVATKATFTAGSWTKHAANPILVPRGAWNLSITLDITAGSRFFRVANNADFDVGAPILLWTPSDPDSCEINWVSSKAGSTDVGVRYPWLGSYTVAGGNKVSQIQSRSVDPCEVWFDTVDSKWKTIFTAFRFCPDANRESVGYAETSDLSAGFAIQPSIWPLNLQPRRVAPDRYSAENLKWIEVS